MSEEIDINKLKSYTQAFMNHVHYVQHQFEIKPTKQHYLTAINYTDISERKDDFLSALINTVTSWVFNKATREKILAEQESISGDKGYAASFLTNLANKKFRPGHPQGQFGELLLFNFLQHFFHAVPMLRKQQITTNENSERQGADAIHYSNLDGKNLLFLGESKCYESKYQFSTAFGKSLSSIKDTFTRINEELEQYTYFDFIEDNLLNIAKAYKNGTLNDVHFQLVCIVIYHETNALKMSDEQDIKKQILQIVNDRCKNVEDEKFSDVAHLIDRIHYIFFPVWALDDLLDKFSKRVGAA